MYYALSGGSLHGCPSCRYIPIEGRKRKDNATGNSLCWRVCAFSSYSKPCFYFLVAVSDGSVVGDGAPGIVGRGLSIPLLGSDCPLIAPSPGVAGRDPVLLLSTCPGLCVPGLSLPGPGRLGNAPMFPVPVPVFPVPAAPVPVCPLGPVPEICASTRGAATQSTARAPTRDLPSLRNICVFSWSNTGYASLLTSTPSALACAEPLERILFE